MTNLGRQSAILAGVLVSLWVVGCGGSSNSGGGGGCTTCKTLVPQIGFAFSSLIISPVQSLVVTVTLSGSSGTPTGSITLTSGSYASAPTLLASGSGSITIPAGTLPAGDDPLNVNYSPAGASTSVYTAGFVGSSGILVEKLIAAVTVTPAFPNITTLQSLSVAVTVSGSATTPTGSVVLVSGSYTSPATALVNGSASITIAAGSLALGGNNLSVTYTADAASSPIYDPATSQVGVAVTQAAPIVTVTSGFPSITVNQSLSVTVAVYGGYGDTLPTGSVTLSGGGYTSSATTLTNGSAHINIPANSLTTGTDTLTASYTPDAAGSAIYISSAGTGQVTVTSGVAYTLTIDSTAPASGILISPVFPSDNNGAGAGATPFTLVYNSGAQVTLSAPLSDNTYAFVSWSGCTSTSGASGINCNVTMSASTTVTANYNQAGITSITVTPSTATIGAQQQFTATVHGNGSYSTGVTWSLSCSSCGSLSAGAINANGLYSTPYPAPASVTVTATSTMTGFTNVSGSATVTLSPPATATGPALSVDVNTPNTSSENPHTISPYVYGMNGYILDSASEKIANPGIVRWGGDDTSRYNYQLNMTNSASDYYFENFLGGGGQFPNATGSTNFTQFVQSTDAAGSTALGTMPVLGWVSNNSQYACSFTQSQFPSQQSFESGCGNGVLTSGVDLNGSNGTTATQIPNITSLSEPPPNIAAPSATPTSSTVPNPGSVTSTWADGTWPGSWVNSLVTNSNLGNGASGKGVAVWDLDNEPTWWDAVHRDVHSVPFTYDEVTNGGIGTALAIKTADPTALVSGPVIDYWEAYFYSKKDIENGWGNGSPCYQPWSAPIDREAHGGIPMIEYYMQQFKNYSQQYGVRLLDYVDIHGYFAPDYPVGSGNSVAFTTAGDTQEQEARMNATRVFWDPTYTDPNEPQPNYITDANFTTNCNPPAQAPQLIPMLRAWVANDYPGTKTAIDEYNFGGLESINGAVAQADILGIFGRQGLGMGAFWPTTNYSSQGPGNYAFAMYRNYDGNDSTFGNTYLYATSTSSGGDGEGQLSVYGAQRTADNAITVMVINKTYGPLTSTISLENFSAASGTTAQIYQYSNANLNAIVQQAGVSVTPPVAGGTTSTISSFAFPAQSITLFVVPN